MKSSSLNLPEGSRYLLLPAVPAETSMGLRLATARYLAAFFADDDASAWDAAAKAIEDCEAASLTDIAVKLLYAVHYLEPSRVDGVLAVDLGSFDADAGRMLVRCAADALRLAEKGAR